MKNKPMFGRSRIAHDAWMIAWVCKQLFQLGELLEAAAVSQEPTRRTVYLVVVHALDWAAEQLKATDEEAA